MRITLLSITILFSIILPKPILFAQDHENVEHEGRLYNFWDKPWGIVINDRTAYVMTGSSGLQSLDISDPEALVMVGSNPYIKSFRDEDIPGNGARGLKLVGDVLYVIDQAGLRSIDVSDSFNFEVMDQYDDYGNGMGLEISGNTCWTTDYEQGLIILRADNLRRIGNLGNIGSLIAISKPHMSRYAFVAAGEDGLLAVDVFFYDRPVLRATYDVGFARGVTYDDEYVYVTGDGLTIFSNIDEPWNLQEQGNWGEDIQTEYLLIKEESVYVIGDNCLYIINIEHADEPFLISEIDLSPAEGIFSMDFSGDYLYLTDRRGSLLVIDVEDEDSPEVIATFPEEHGSLNNFVIESNFVYLVDNYGSLRLVDIYRDNPVEIASFELPVDRDSINARLMVDEQLVFMAIEDEGLLVVDTYDPYAIEVIARLDHPSIKDVVFMDNIAYLMLAKPDSMALHDGAVVTYDFSNLNDPQFLGMLEFEDVEMDNAILAEHEGYLYVATNNNRVGLVVLDMSDPQNLREVGRYDTDWDDIDEIVFSMDYALLGQEREELQVLDVSEPDEIFEVAVYENFGWGYAVSESGETLVVSNAEAGIVIYNIADISNPVETGYYETPGDPVCKVMYNGLLYTSGISSLNIYDCSEAMDISGEIQDIPGVFSLAPAYPNPFNSFTTIIYNLPIDAAVSLQLYDLSGREVRTLVEGDRQPGVHTTTLNAANLPSGLYFVRLEAAGQVQTRKVMLIR